MTNEKSITVKGVGTYGSRSSLKTAIKYQMKVANEYTEIAEYEEARRCLGVASKMIEALMKSIEEQEIEITVSGVCRE